jgi:hypothetical protein
LLKPVRERVRSSQIEAQALVAKFLVKEHGGQEIAERKAQPLIFKQALGLP